MTARDCELECMQLATMRKAAARRADFLAGRFVPVDPLPERARRSAAERLELHLKAAKLWLAFREIRRRDEAKAIRRSGLRLIAGGRP